MTNEGEPSYFQETSKGNNNIKWKKAMQEELKSLHDNNMWELVEWPKGRNVLKNKWVCHIKHEGKENKQGFKERLVVKRFGKEQGIDFT